MYNMAPHPNIYTDIRSIQVLNGMYSCQGRAGKMTVDRKNYGPVHLYSSVGLYHI
jgi:hypothetical protein